MKKMVGLKGYSLGTQFDVWSALKSEERAAVNSLNEKLDKVQTAFKYLSNSIATTYHSNGEDTDSKLAVPVCKSLDLGRALGVGKDALKNSKKEFNRVAEEVHKAADMLPNTFYTEYSAFGKTFGGAGKIAETKLRYANTLREIRTLPALDDINKAASFLDVARSVLEPAYTNTDTYKAVEAAIIDLEELTQTLYDLNTSLTITEDIFRAKPNREGLRKETLPYVGVGTSSFEAPGGPPFDELEGPN